LLQACPFSILRFPLVQQVANQSNKLPTW